MNRVTVMLTLLLILPSFATANELERMTVDYFELLDYENYEAVARMHDPEDLKAVREAFAFLNDAPDEFRLPLYERMFGAWASQASVEKLSDAEFFAGFLVTSASVARRSNVSNMRAEYLGQVDEGSDLAHVVVRTSAEGPGGEYSAVSVDTYVKRDGQWRLKLSSDFDATIQRYRAAYARYQQRAARREAAQQE